MKKKIIVILSCVAVLNTYGAVMAAPNAFSDVPAKHWSYNAVMQLGKFGIVDGYGDGSFGGEKTISRYEMAIIVARAMTKMDKADAANKALIEKLENEYAPELKKIGALEERVIKVEDKVDKVTFSGMVRAKYDNQNVNGSNVNDGNNHVYFDFEGSLKVNDNWSAHFQSETQQHYDSTKAATDVNNNTFERIWVTGIVGGTGVTVGRKWDSSAYSIAEGCEATGVWLDFGKVFKTTLFAAKPSGTDNWNVNMYGIKFATKIANDTHLHVTVAGNKDVGIGITSWGEIGFDTKLSKDFKFTAAYAKTNAISYNNNQEYRLDYRGADLNVPGSYGIYIRYLKLGLNGSLTHDDEWGSLSANIKGPIFGFDYILGKNIEWSTLYANTRFIASGTYSGLAVTTNELRRLFRSQVDFHFY